MAALREVLAFFEIDWDKRGLEAGGKAVDSAITKLQTLGKTIAGAAIVVGLRNMVHELEAQAGALDDASQQLSVSTSELQEYRYAAQMAGVANEMLDQSLRTLQKNQGAAAAGAAEQASTFRKLGIEMTGARLAAVPLSTLLPQIADGLAGIESPAERSALAAKLLGDAGVKLLPMLAGGSAGLAKYGTELEALGGGLTDDAVKGLTEFGDAQNRLNMGMLSLKVQLSKGIIPALSLFAERTAYILGRISRFTNGVREATKNSNILTGTFTVLGAAGVSKLFAMAGGWSGIGKLIMQASRVLGIFLLRLALPALLIDELITTWQGGDTIITRIIDGWFGEGKTAEIVANIKEWIKSAKEFFDDLVNSGALSEGAVIGLAAGFYLLAKRIGIAAAAALKGQTPFMRLLGPIVAITAAVWALNKAWEAWQSLDKDLEGSGGITGTVGKMWDMGTFDVFKAHDAALNEKAMAAQPKVVTAPVQRNSSSSNAYGPTNITTNVTVPPGTPASMADRVAHAAGQAAQKSSSRRATKAATQNQVD